MAKESDQRCDYGDFLLGRLQQLREDDFLCDIELDVRGDVFRVHRVMLAACSDYFRALFTHGTTDSAATCVQLPTLTAGGVGAVLAHMYTGSLPAGLFQQKNAVKELSTVLQTASFLQAPATLSACEAAIIEHLTFDNAADLITLAESCGVGAVIRTTHEARVLSNWHTFVHTPAFLALDAVTLARFLADDRLRTSNERTLLCDSIRWFTVDPSRCVHAADILRHIRLTLDGWSAIEFASSEEPFVSNASCVHILNNARQLMRQPTRRYLSADVKVRYHRETLVQFGGITQYYHPVEGAICKPIGFIYYHHNEHRNWHAAKRMVEHSHCPLVAVGGHAIAAGGYMYMSQPLTQTVHRSCMNEVKLLTPDGFALWDLAYMNEPRAQHVVVLCAGFLYAVAGKNTHTSLRSVEKFNMHKEHWSFVSPLDNAVYDHAGAEYEHQVYICGGVGNGNVIQSEVFSYSAEDDLWLPRPPMIRARAGHTATSINGLFIVCGGLTKADESSCTATVEAYDGVSSQWTQLAPMRNECCYATSVVLDGKLLIAGGQNAFGDVQSRIQSYDPANTRWSCTFKLCEPLKNFGCCAMTINMTDNWTDEMDGQLDKAHDRPEEDGDDTDEYFSDEEDREEWRRRQREQRT